MGVAAAGEGELSTRVHFGPERDLQIELDRDLAIQVKGVPACTYSPLLQTGLSIEETCASAQVGSGEETIEVAFAESEPIKIPAKVRIFNGGEHDGTITLYVHGTFAAPIRGALLTKVVITRIHNGRLGWLADAAFPQVMGGTGSIFDLNLQLTRPGVFSTRCVDGKFEAKVRIGFEDGTDEERGVGERCGDGGLSPEGSCGSCHTWPIP